MTAPRRLVDYALLGLLLSILSGAIGYMSAVAQFSTRLAIVEQQSKKIDAIYFALVERGVIQVPKTARWHGGTAAVKTLVAIGDRDWRRDCRDRGEVGAAPGAALGAGCATDWRSGRRDRRRIWRTPRAHVWRRDSLRGETWAI